MSLLKAIIFGAIGVIAETSDLQRKAFNTAFEEANLDWFWDVATYRDLLLVNGGQARLCVYRDENPDKSPVSDALIAALHKRKTHHFATYVNDGAVVPRSGVVELMQMCQAAGIRMAFCTSTSIQNVNAIRDALSQKLDFSMFESVTTIDKIDRVKPAPDAYLYCLEQLGLSADTVIAIEDTPVSMASAIAAGIAVIATPGMMTKDQDFSSASRIVYDLGSLTLHDFEAVLTAK